MLSGELAGGARKTLTPALQGHRQQRLGQCRSTNQTQGSGVASPEIVGQAAQVLQVDGEALGLLLQQSRLGGGLQFAAHPIEQGEAQLLLGMLENLARRRLGDMQQLGRGSEAAGLQNRLEQFDMTQTHVRPSSSPEHNRRLWLASILSLAASLAGA